MAMRFDLLAAGVLAPGVGSFETMLDLADRGAPPRPPSSGIGRGGVCGLGRCPTSGRINMPTTRVPDFASEWVANRPGETFVAPPVLSLPANERRRASAVVRLVLACAEQALARRPELASCVRLVFAADEGVGDVCQTMLEALANEQPVSPLVFANSVHNAPSGYFSIAHRNRRPATSLSLGEQSFACGLLTAAAEAQATREPVLFVNYDSPLPMPLRSVLPIGEPSATAWLIVASDEEGSPALLRAPAARLDARDGDRAGAPSSAGGIHAGASSPARPLASFLAELVEMQVHDGCDPFDVAPLRFPLDHRPAWLPRGWASNSSALGVAALGLVGAAQGVRDFSLGRQALRLSRLADAPS
jgi:hypothetical protein